MKNYPLSICIAFCLSASLLSACNTSHQLGCNDQDVALKTAAKGKKPAEVQALLEAGANPNATCEKHCNPILVEVATNGDIETLKALLEGGADVNSKNFWQWTALYGAAGKGHIDVVQLLLEWKANPNIPHYRGSTPIMSAAAIGNIAIMNLLHAAGARMDEEDMYGETALMIAAQNGHKAAVALLLTAGAAINKDSDGSTALMVAAQHGRKAVVEQLLAAGADVDKKANNTKIPSSRKAKNGETALIVATRGGHTDIVQLLLKEKAQMDIQDNDGHTPLMVGIMSTRAKGKMPLLKALIDAPQDFNLKNNKGKTALDIAREKLKTADQEDKEIYSLVIAMLQP